MSQSYIPWWTQQQLAGKLPVKVRHGAKVDITLFWIANSQVSAEAKRCRVYHESFSS